jgi:hypothetical protein
VAAKASPTGRRRQSTGRTSGPTHWAASTKASGSTARAPRGHQQMNRAQSHSRGGGGGGVVPAVAVAVAAAAEAAAVWRRRGGGGGGGGGRGGGGGGRR